MMKNVKILSALLLLSIFFFSFSSCGGVKTENNNMSFEQNPPFQIQSSFYQDWIAGVEDGGSGTNIEISFKSIDEDVVIQNIYFQNQKVEAKTKQQNLQLVSGYLVKEKNREIVMDIDPLKEASNTIKSDFPFQLNENEAVLEYWFKGEKNYFKLSAIQKKELLPYPSSNKSE